MIGLIDMSGTMPAKKIRGRGGMLLLQQQPRRHCYGVTGLTLLGWSGVLGAPCLARRMCLSGALFRMEFMREAAAGRGRPDLGGRLACSTSSRWSSCANSSWTACWPPSCCSISCSLLSSMNCVFIRHNRPMTIRMQECYLQTAYSTPVFAISRQTSRLKKHSFSTWW